MLCTILILGSVSEYSPISPLLVSYLSSCFSAVVVVSRTEEVEDVALGRLTDAI